jgi:hypothetical protein
MLKYVPAVALLLAAGPVFAQAGATQSPPTPNAGASMPQSANSLPAGAANMNTGSVQNPNLAGSAIGGVTTGAPAATSSGPGAATSTTVPKPASR